MKISRFSSVFLLLALLQMPAQAQEVYNYSPSAGSQVATPRPTISALFAQGIRPDRILVDGTDFTAQASKTSNSIAWTPQYDLDRGQHRVEVFGRGTFNSKVRGEWTFVIGQSGYSPGSSSGTVPTPTRTGVSPAPGSTVGSRPTVSATFTQQVLAGTARLLVDGADYTAQSRQSGNQISWTPGFDLAPGTHQAQATAIDLAGRGVQESWSFNVTTGSTTGGPTIPNLPPANSSAPVLISNPKAGVPVERSFFIQGRSFPGARLRVEFYDPRTMRRSFAFEGVADGAGYFSIPASASSGTWKLMVFALDGAGNTLPGPGGVNVWVK
ncbi:MAG: hypothetical protein HY319_29060 [Armatimonadetes bacterium]|nr:hypothetical protein [Armatimonadota bacterium]